MPLRPYSPGLVREYRLRQVLFLFACLLYIGPIPILYIVDCAGLIPIHILFQYNQGDLMFVCCFAPHRHSTHVFCVALPFLQSLPGSRNESTPLSLV